MIYIEDKLVEDHSLLSAQRKNLLLLEGISIDIMLSTYSYYVKFYSQKILYLLTYFVCGAKFKGQQ